MKTLKAKVHRGRLKVDVPTKLPEGTVLELMAADPSLEPTDEDQLALHAALESAWESAKAGKLSPASRLLTRLKNKR